MNWLASLGKSMLHAAQGAVKTLPVAVSKVSPKALVVGGVVGFGATTVMACNATVKADRILYKRDMDLSELEIVREQMSEDDAVAEEKKIKRKARFDIVKAYSGAACMGLTSAACVLGGYKLIDMKYVRTVAAYQALDAGFEAYRGNVKEEYGEEVDWKMLHGKNGKMTLEEAKQTKVQIEKKPRTNYMNDMYKFVFNEDSDRWKRYWTPYAAMDYLKTVQGTLNNTLHWKGYVSLNEALDALGMKPVDYGFEVGWVKNKNYPDSFIDFGLDDIPEEILREILGAPTNEDIWIPITFNVDGLMSSKVETPKLMHV